MKNSAALFLLTAFLLMQNSSYATTIDEIGKTTICFRKAEQVYELKNGKKVEVWLKDPETGRMEPKLNIYIGTGFLVDHNKHLYIVTAGHIAKALTRDSAVIWNSSSGQGKGYTFEFLEKNLRGSKWFFHPTTDIAVHPFGFIEKSDHIIVPEAAFVTSREGVRLLTKVCVVGYPLGLGINNALSPIAKRTEIASWTTSLNNPVVSPDLKFILLDDDLAEGYSGAPVFISPEPQMVDNTFVVSGVQAKLIGIQSMTIADQTGGKISLVVPISYLSDIYESDDFKRYEREFAGAGGT